MKSRLSLFAFAASLTLAVSGAACSSPDPDPTPAEPLVKVPEVPASVAVDTLCDLAAQIQCAGATGCCDSKPPFGSVDECLAAYSACDAQVAAVTGNALFTAKTVSYDATAAAAMLKKIAAATSECGNAAPALDLNEVFVGSLAKGTDCSAKDQSGVFMLSCAPGLFCDVRDNDEAGTSSATCETAVDPTVGNDEFTAEANPSAEELYCVAPPEMKTPNNADPTHLSINTVNSDNAGTTSDITLHFIADGSKTEYYCTITGGIAKNTTKICAVQTRTWSSASGNDLFYVGNNSNDGLAVDSVAVCTAASATECTSTKHTAGTFDSGNESMLSNRIEWAFDAFDDGFGRFYVDGDDAGNCTMAKIKLDDDNTVNCAEDHSH